MESQRESESNSERQNSNPSEQHSEREDQV